MRLILFIGFVFVSLCGLAQKDQSWSEEINGSSNVIKTIPKNKDSYYVVSTTGNSFKELRIRYFNFGKIQSDNSLSPVVNGIISRVEDIFIVGEQLYVFFSEESTTGNKLYAQRLDEQGQLTDVPFMLGEQEIKGGLTEKSINYIINTSPDRKHLVVSYLFNNTNVFEFPDLVTSVYNENLSRVKIDRTKTEYYLSRSSLEAVSVDNYGTVLTLIQGFLAPSSSKLTYNSLDLYKLSAKNNMEHIVLESGENAFYNPLVAMYNDSVYTIAYQYNTVGKWKPNGGSIGVMFYDYNAKKQKLSEKQSMEYDKKDLESNLTPKEYKKYEKAVAKGRPYNLALYRYKLRDLNLLSDSSRLLIMEETWTEAGFYQAGRSYINYTIYNFNSIRLMKFDAQLVRDYSITIPKYQISRDDNGYYSSFFSYLNSEEKLYLMFNDNVNNYTYSGEYVASKQPYNFTGSNNRFCTTLVELDAKTGNYQRKVMFTKSDMDNLFVPRIYERDGLFHSVILTFNRRNKFCFANMVF